MLNLATGMDKVACCCLRNGAPSPSFSKPSLPYTIARSTWQPLPPCRRSISILRCIMTNPKRATGNGAIDVATGCNTTTKPGGGSGAGIFSFDFEQYMSANAKAVHEALDRALPVRQPERLSEAMRYSALAGGKLVRPVLAIAACELVGGSAAAATPVACAVEMVHAMSLIHDDMPCMDDDVLRRGRPANHVAFGEYTALLSGDALLALAFEHLARGCAGLGVVPAERALRSVAELANAAGAGGVAAGQVADKASEGAPVSLAMLEYIHLQKTARLLEAAAVCGAIVGGGTDGEIESVRRYARSVGLLFQVVDDVLDVSRTSEQLGKTAGKDQAADKATYPKLLGVDQAQAYAAELLAMAQGELEGFDAERAAPLHHLARFIAYRQN